MAAPRISIDEKRCVCIGECVVIAADLFDQRETDGVSTVIGTPESQEQLDRLHAAVKACPSGAISVT